LRQQKFYTLQIYNSNLHFLAPLKSFDILALYKFDYYYAPQLYRHVLLWRVLAMGILSVCLSVCHDPVRIQG